ncbi:MAG: nuclear transport factor 2 family protein [Deltaproteobacteria bacterium]|jgi:steroid delta-isomerase|nr:nuclear transport factor 2 family protein [Deltaproteobacteria bacterium]
MPTPDEIRNVMQSYIKALSAGDVESILDLYADECTVEDPVGGTILRGRESLQSFYSATAPALYVEITGPICVASNQCAAPLVAELTTPDAKMYADVIDVMSFNDAGKITSMRAYWSPAELRPTR